MLIMADCSTHTRHAKNSRQQPMQSVEKTVRNTGMQLLLCGAARPVLAQQMPVNDRQCKSYCIIRWQQ